jgi:hypothetical protein
MFREISYILISHSPCIGAFQWPITSSITFTDYFPNYMFILTHPVNFPCSRKLEHPEPKLLHPCDKLIISYYVIIIGDSRQHAQVKGTYIIQLLPIGAFQWPITSSISFTCIIYFAYRQFIFTIIVITFLTMFFLTHPVNFPCSRKLEHPEPKLLHPCDKLIISYYIIIIAKIDRKNWKKGTLINDLALKRAKKNG